MYRGSLVTLDSKPILVTVVMVPTVLTLKICCSFATSSFVSPSSTDPFRSASGFIAFSFSTVRPLAEAMSETDSPSFPS